jgi:hypothetical protein
LELWFGRLYRPGWERERIRLMKEFVDWLVMWQVGKRQAFERTDFGYKQVAMTDEGQKTQNGTTGEKRNGTIAADATDDKVEDTDGNVRVHVDRVYIKALKRRYYRVIVFEPALLIGGLICTLGWTFWDWSRH